MIPEKGIKSVFKHYMLEHVLVLRCANCGSGVVADRDMDEQFLKEHVCWCARCTVPCKSQIAGAVRAAAMERSVL
jgi:hypothetical protein